MFSWRMVRSALFQTTFLSYCNSIESVARSYAKGQILVNEIASRHYNSCHYTRSMRDLTIQIRSPGHRLDCAQSALRRHSQPVRLLERLARVLRIRIACAQLPDGCAHLHGKGECRKMGLFGKFLAGDSPVCHRCWPIRTASKVSRNTGVHNLNGE